VVVVEACDLNGSSTSPLCCTGVGQGSPRRSGRRIANRRRKGKGDPSLRGPADVVAGYLIACSSWERIAGFSRVETSWVIVSPFASDRSRRRMILPERVFGRLSPKRISSGFAMGPIS